MTAPVTQHAGLAAVDALPAEAALAAEVSMAVALLANQVAINRMILRAASAGQLKLDDTMAKAIAAAERDCFEMVQRLGEVRGMPRKAA